MRHDGDPITGAAQRRCNKVPTLVTGVSALSDRALLVCIAVELVQVKLCFDCSGAVQLLMTLPDGRSCT
jgi:hypothetical protein